MQNFGRTNIDWFATEAARDAFYPSPVAGQISGVGDDLWKHNGVGWLRVATDLFDLTKVGNDYPGKTLVDGMKFEWNAAAGYFTPRSVRGCIRRHTATVSLTAAVEATVTMSTTVYDSGDGVNVNTTEFLLNALGLWQVEVSLRFDPSGTFVAASRVYTKIWYPGSSNAAWFRVPVKAVGAIVTTLRTVVIAEDTTSLLSVRAYSSPAGSLSTTAYAPQCSVMFMGSKRGVI